MTEKPAHFEIAVLASGCFWGTEYYLKKLPGVFQTKPGYTGGHLDNPTYEMVCTGTTGHAEAVEVYFDTTINTYEEVLKYFFETHIFTQNGGIGPDIGDQYRSVVFYLTESQRRTAIKIINELINKGFTVQTKLTKFTSFWEAEPYHQNYYYKKGETPYCHIYKKIFAD